MNIKVVTGGILEKNGKFLLVEEKKRNVEVSGMFLLVV